MAEFQLEGIYTRQYNSPNSTLDSEYIFEFEKDGQMRYLGFDWLDAVENRNNGTINYKTNDLGWKHYYESQWEGEMGRYEEKKGNWIHEDTNGNGSIDYFELFCDNWNGLDRTWFNIFGDEADGGERVSVDLDDLTFTFYNSYDGFYYLESIENDALVGEIFKTAYAIASLAAIVVGCYQTFPLLTTFVTGCAISFALGYCANEWF
jgi:hypothetical protein